MADFTNLSEERVLDWWGNIGSPTRPTNHHVALFYTTPTADDGTGGTECNGVGYSRQSITWTRSAQTLNPTATITFGPATSAWSTVNGFGIYDNSSGGNLLAFEDLTTPRTLGAGDSAEFATSDLSVTLD
jgi:hypothetical protein